MSKSSRNNRNPEVQRRISELIEAAGGGYNEDLVADLVEQSLKLLSDVENRGDALMLRSALRELRYALRLFAPYAGIRKVTVFGSARTTPDRTEYKLAAEFGREIAAAGWMVITGAGPGIMQAGHEGAGPEKSFGVNIRLPWEQSANPVIEHDRKLINFRYFFTRKLVFVRHADAVALFPGGYGTMDEGFEVLTLMQTGKSQLMPLVLVDRPGGTYWKTWDKNIREHLLRNGLISADDLYLYQITDDVEQAIRTITRFYRNYDSMRFVKERLVLRLKNIPSPSAVEALNEDFADIIAGEKIAVVETTPEEMEDADRVELPRIAFEFDRRHYGRLRQLIDAVNSL